MVSPCGRYSLIFNGMIYNYTELRQELEHQGFDFRSTSDTEVLLYSLIHFGIPNALNEFTGMFSFAFFDSFSYKVFLANINASIVPLILPLLLANASSINELSKNSTRSGRLMVDLSSLSMRGWSSEMSASFHNSRCVRDYIVI